MNISELKPGDRFKTHSGIIFLLVKIDKKVISFQNIKTKVIHKHSIDVPFFVEKVLEVKK
jgi:hypothetical protein